MRKVDKEEIAAELVEYCETSPSSLIWKTGIVGRVDEHSIKFKELK